MSAADHRVAWQPALLGRSWQQLSCTVGLHFRMSACCPHIADVVSESRRLGVASSSFMQPTQDHSTGHTLTYAAPLLHRSTAALWMSTALLLRKQISYQQPSVQQPRASPMATAACSCWRQIMSTTLTSRMPQVSSVSYAACCSTNWFSWQDPAVL